MYVKYFVLSVYLCCVEVVIVAKGLPHAQGWVVLQPYEWEERPLVYCFFFHFGLFKLKGDLEDMLEIFFFFLKPLKIWDKWCVGFKGKLLDLSSVPMLYILYNCMILYVFVIKKKQVLGHDEN